MKKIILVLSFLSICSLAYSDVFILYKTDTKEIISIQDDDSAVLETGYTKKIIQGKTIADYQFEYRPEYYKMSGDKFVVNTKKISDEENEKTVNQEKKGELNKINQRALKIACEQLISEGASLKHVKCNDFDKQ